MHLFYFFVMLLSNTHIRDGHRILLDVMHFHEIAQKGILVLSFSQYLHLLRGEKFINGGT